MTSTGTMDEWLEEVARGQALAEAQLLDLAERADILELGMLADAVRRHRHGARTTYVRVADVALDHGDIALPPATGEVALTGAPAGLDTAL